MFSPTLKSSCCCQRLPWNGPHRTHGFWQEPKLKGLHRHDERVRPAQHVFVACVKGVKPHLVSHGPSWLHVPSAALARSISSGLQELQVAPALRPPTPPRHRKKNERRGVRGSNSNTRRVPNLSTSDNHGLTATGVAKHARCRALFPTQSATFPCPPESPPVRRAAELHSNNFKGSERSSEGLFGLPFVLRVGLLGGNSRSDTWKPGLERVEKMRRKEELSSLPSSPSLPLPFFPFPAPRLKVGAQLGTSCLPRACLGAWQFIKCPVELAKLQELQLRKVRFVAPAGPSIYFCCKSFCCSVLSHSSQKLSGRSVWMHICYSSYQAP